MRKVAVLAVVVAAVVAVVAAAAAAAAATMPQWRYTGRFTKGQGLDIVQMLDKFNKDENLR
jgi:hypothetical protein